MEKISNLLKENLLKEIKIKPSNRKCNINWEEAEQMGKYLKLNTIFILKLFKLYGKGRVLSLQSYLKDFNGNCKLEQVLVWKLQHSLTSTP